MARTQDQVMQGEVPSEPPSTNQYYSPICHRISPGHFGRLLS